MEQTVNSFSSMTKEEALSYCYKHKEKYIKDYDSISEGVRGFDCLILLVEEGLNPTELPKYGMDYEQLAVK